jgi:hypothetical protein
MTGMMEGSRIRNYYYWRLKSVRRDTRNLSDAVKITKADGCLDNLGIVAPHFLERFKELNYDRFRRQ